MTQTCLNKEEISRWVNWSSEMSTHPKWRHVRSCTICAEGINQFRKSPVNLSLEDTNGTKNVGFGQPLLAPIPTPNTVDGYRLVRFLGLGSSGQVWLAEELGVGRQVAIKYLNQFGLKENRTRLLREARILSSVNHPSLLRIFGSGVDKDSAWLILEYCPGGSLGDRIRNGIRHSPEEAASLLVQIADALVLVHQKGIIHRDIKPDNILFSHDNKPRLADFGLARMDDASASLTTVGDILGTPAYISPEQVRGGKVGPSADIHALGGVLYHLMTGSAPFKAASAFQAMALAESVTPISPLITDPNLPVDLVNVCLKCLQKNPKDRYGSAADFAEDLREFLAGQRVKARPLGLATQISRWTCNNRLLSLSICATIVTMIAGTIISTALAIQANAAKAIAELSTIRSEKQYYNSEMRNIQSAIEKGRIGLARERLVALEPKEAGRDFRGFEWFYWKRKLKPTPEEFSIGVRRLRSAILSPKGDLLLLDKFNQLHRRDNLSGLTHALTTIDDPKMGEIDPNGHFALLTNTMGKGLLVDSRSNIAQSVGPMSDQPLSHFLLSPDAKKAFVIPLSNKSPIFCWDIAKNQRVREVGLVPKFIGTPILNPLGTKIAFILQDLRIGILDLEKGKMLVSPALDISVLRQIGWGFEDNAIIGIGADALGYGQLLKWIPGNEKLLMPFPDGKQPMKLANWNQELIGVADSQSAIHFFNQKLLRIGYQAGSGNMPMAIWNSETRVGLVDEKGAAQEFNSPSLADFNGAKTKDILAGLAWFCPDKLLFTGLSNKAELRAFPFNRATPLTFDNSPKSIYCAADRQGRVFVAMGDKIQRIDHDGKILYGGNTPKAVRALGAEGDRVLVQQTDGTGVLLDAETLGHSFTLSVPAKAAALSPNADSVVLINPSGRIQILRTADGSELEEFDPLDLQAATVTMSTNGTVYVGFFGGLIRAFESGKRQTPKDFQGHNALITALELSPDNRRLASASVDGQIRLWDLDSGQDLMVLNASQNKSVIRLRFSPDGQNLGCTNAGGPPDIFDARP